jgi:nucleoside-diphosphate-sugar epimerase
MNSAVIIGCGYVGKAVAQRWQPTLQVTATTTTITRVSELEGVAHRVVILNGTDLAGVRSLLQDQSIVLLSVGARSGDAYEETYLGTARTLVEALKDAPAVQQVIYTGSYAVYGDQGGAWVDEESAIAPTNRNGEILAETEQVLLSVKNAVKVCIFRLGGIYGPGRTLVRIFGRSAGTTRPGSGDEPSNWVHLDDIVGAIDFARQHQLEGVYNLVGSVPLPVRVLLDRVCSQNGLPAVAWDPTQPSNRAYNARVSNQKLRTAGYQFVHPEVVETG